MLGTGRAPRVLSFRSCSRNSIDPLLRTAPKGHSDHRNWSLIVRRVASSHDGWRYSCGVGSYLRGPVAMKPNSLETEELLRHAAAGDDWAVSGLFERHRGRLRRMIAARLDRRIAARVDPSDVVQEALGEASGRLAAFVRDRPVPFYFWLKRLTLQHLSWSHRFHLRSRKRCAAREVGLDTRPAATSSAAGCDRLPGDGTSPSQNAVRDEECEQVRAVLGQLESL